MNSMDSMGRGVGARLSPMATESWPLNKKIAGSQTPRLQYSRLGGSEHSRLGGLEAWRAWVGLESLEGDIGGIGGLQGRSSTLDAHNNK